jgi:hypothetical protein
MKLVVDFDLEVVKAIRETLDTVSEEAPEVSDRIRKLIVRVVRAQKSDDLS